MPVIPIAAMIWPCCTSSPAATRGGAIPSSRCAYSDTRPDVRDQHDHRTVGKMADPHHATGCRGDDRRIHLRADVDALVEVRVIHAAVHARWLTPIRRSPEALRELALRGRHPRAVRRRDHRVWRQRHRFSLELDVLLLQFDAE